MLALLTTPAVVVTAVSDRHEPVPGIVILGLHAPELANNVRPGQFVMVVPPAGERCSTALALYECDGERVSLMVVVVGPRTRQLAELTAGSALTVFGPLGNGFDVEGLGDDVGVIAGGVGIASVFLLARALRERAARVRLYFGARTAGALVGADAFAELGCVVTLATDDGSRGHHGFVTEPLACTVSDHAALAACGPSPMLRAVGAIAVRCGVRAQLSLEEAFACGVGACWGCAVPLSRDSAQAPSFPPPNAGEHRDYVHARICTEGPVFWAHELRW